MRQVFERAVHHALWLVGALVILASATSFEYVLNWQRLMLISVQWFVIMALIEWTRKSPEAFPSRLCLDLLVLILRGAIAVVWRYLGQVSGITAMLLSFAVLIRQADYRRRRNG